MQPFESYRGVIAPLDRANVDTDQIIPKQFLKSILRTGFGESLFFDWRYLEDGRDDPQFALNQPVYRNASTLVVRNNFGCGSSREHAVWAVQQFGFRTVIAPSQEHGGAEVPAFADIFRNNAAKNGLLTVELPAADVDRIFSAIAAAPGTEATVDLAAQRVTLHGSPEESFRFEIDPTVRDHLIRGLDDIALTLEHADAIDQFEAGYDPQLRR